MTHTDLCQSDVGQGEPDTVIHGVTGGTELRAALARAEKAERERDAAVEIVRGFVRWCDGMPLEVPIVMSGKEGPSLKAARRLLESLSSAGALTARAEAAEKERDAAVVALKLAADRLEEWENDRCQHYGSCHCNSESDEARRLLESLKSSAGKGAGATVDGPGQAVSSRTESGLTSGTLNKQGAPAPKAEDTPARTEGT